MILIKQIQYKNKTIQTLVSSYVYNVFGAQRSRDCTVTVLVSQIKIPDSQKCTGNKMNSHDSKCTETVLMFQIFLKSWFSVPPLPDVSRRY